MGGVAEGEALWDLLMMMARKALLLPLLLTTVRYLLKNRTQGCGGGPRCNVITDHIASWPSPSTLSPILR